MKAPKVLVELYLLWICLAILFSDALFLSTRKKTFSVNTSLLLRRLEHWQARWESM